MQTLKPPVVWVIDDALSNYRMVQRSMPQPQSEYTLIHYLDAREALLELSVFLSEDNGLDHLPDIIFMDHFLGDIYGTEVTERVRQLFAQAGLRGPYIIGHSSLFQCSQAIQEIGGDTAFHKNANWARSPEIVAAFPEVESLAPFIGYARAPAS